MLSVLVIVMIAQYNITCTSHSNDSPVQCLRKSIKHGVWLIFLQGITKTGKYEHAHAHSHAQEQQFSEEGKLVATIHPFQNIYYL